MTWLTEVSVGVINFTKQTNVLTTGLEFLGAVAAVKAIGSLKEIAHVLGILKPSIGQTVIALLEFAAPILILAALYFAFDSPIGPVYIAYGRGDAGRQSVYFFVGQP